MKFYEFTSRLHGQSIVAAKDHVEAREFYSSQMDFSEGATAWELDGDNIMRTNLIEMEVEVRYHLFNDLGEEYLGGKKSDYVGITLNELATAKRKAGQTFPMFIAYYEEEQ